MSDKQNTTNSQDLEKRCWRPLNTAPSDTWTQFEVQQPSFTPNKPALASGLRFACNVWHHNEDIYGDMVEPCWTILIATRSKAWIPRASISLLWASQTLAIPLHRLEKQIDFQKKTWRQDLCRSVRRSRSQGVILRRRRADRMLGTSLDKIGEAQQAARAWPEHLEFGIHSRLAWKSDITGARLALWSIPFAIFGQNLAISASAI